eukprot:jgi/Mesvir1/11277/Mv01073-RA.1
MARYSHQFNQLHGHRLTSARMETCALQLRPIVAATADSRVTFHARVAGLFLGPGLHRKQRQIALKSKRMGPRCVVDEETYPNDPTPWERLVPSGRDWARWRKGKIVQSTLFDGNKWKMHRSTNRYLRHLSTLLISRIFTNLTGPILWCLGVSVGVGLYEESLELGTAPFYLTGMGSITPDTLSPLTLTSFALSLLLVFRTNTSYQRWLSASLMWSALLQHAKELVREASVWFKAEDQPLKDAVARWTIALPRCLMSQLYERRVEDDDKVQAVLTEQEMEMLRTSPHGANLCLQALTEIIYVACDNTGLATKMDFTLCGLEEIVSRCERLQRTPVPLSYTRHTSRFLILWCTAMPVFLWHDLEWATPLVTVLITFFLLGIEEIGVQIEEPFSILPLEAFCDGVQDAVSDIMRTSSGLKDYVQGLSTREQGGAKQAQEGGHRLCGGGEEECATRSS